MTENAKPRSLEFFAERAPERIALCEGSRTLSWADWNAQADRLAEQLHAHAGIGRGDFVALCMQNRLEWFVTQAATAKLDASLVPVSFRLTPAEIQYIVKDSGARAFVFDLEDVDGLARVWTDSAVRVSVSLMRSQRPDVLSFHEVSQTGPRVVRYAQHAPRAIVYTSGTTGRPRGVVSKRDTTARPGTDSDSPPPSA
ncbi:MAG TPA: AMP-binding protein, partial [Polyangiales bacterium]|nr:AMP-binding protein [Polyangiales bacterium]